jgi:hypothetical protein
MMKKLILGASVLVCLSAVAQEVAPANAAAARSQEKKSLGLQCQLQATEKKLEGAPKRAFMVKCMNPDTVKVTPAK